MSIKTFKTQEEKELFIAEMEHLVEKDERNQYFQFKNESEKAKEYESRIQIFMRKKSENSINVQEFSQLGLKVIKNFYDYLVLMQKVQNDIKYDDKKILLSLCMKMQEKIFCPNF